MFRLLVCLITFSKENISMWSQNKFVNSVALQIIKNEVSERHIEQEELECYQRWIYCDCASLDHSNLRASSTLAIQKTGIE